MNDISITLLHEKTPLLYNDIKLLKRFSSGAVGIIETVDKEEYIIAYAPYQKGTDPNNEVTKSAYINAFLSQNPSYNHKKDKLKIVVLPFPGKTCISLKNAVPFDRKTFFLDEQYFLRSLFIGCENLYDCPKGNFRLIYYERNTESGILYLGYTLEESFDTSELSELLGDNIRLITFDDFYILHNEYVKERLGLDHEETIAEENTTRKKLILDTIECFIENTPYKHFVSAIQQKVKGQPNLSLILATVYNYLTNLVKGTPYKTNALLAAPSGSGKTETYRALREYFSYKIFCLPVLLIDMSQITEAGYKGRNSDEIFRVIHAKNTFGIAIVFLDELDKKLIPSYGATGINYNAAVQSELLIMLEGGIIYSSNGQNSIDTNNTLFIGLGSFDYARRLKKEKASHRGIGFNTETKTMDDHYNEITLDDLIRQGASYELIGRFSILANYHKLSPKTVQDIILDMTQKLSNALGIEIQLSTNMKNYLLTQANSEYGCRRLRSIIESTALPVYHHLLLIGADFKQYKIVLDEINKAHHLVKRKRPPKS